MPNENELCCSWYKEYLSGWAPRPVGCQQTPRYYMEVDDDLFIYCETCYPKAFSNILQILNPPTLEHGPVHDGVDLGRVYSDIFRPNPYQLHIAPNSTFDTNWGEWDSSSWTNYSFSFDIVDSFDYE